jgi:hypothetical protein
MYWMLFAVTVQVPAALPPRDRARLAEAARLGDQVRDRVWPGWGSIGLPILLVTDSVEFLIGRENPGRQFRKVGYDSLLRQEVWTRPRTFSPTLLATFPAVGGVPTVVVGTAEQTRKASTAWVLTLLHEQFHQMQYSQPDYYPGVGQLGLAGDDDTTGQWMLDYPFPYDSAPVQQTVHQFARSLAAALETSRSDGAAAVRTLLEAQDGVRASLSPADFRYLEFQLWQEGVPRFIELDVARVAADAGPPAEAFRRLPDYEPYDAAADRMRHALMADLERMSLGQSRRLSFYPLGAALALLLDQARADWRTAYLQQPFELTSLFLIKP